MQEFKNSSRPHVFIIQTGSWNLGFTDFKSAIGEIPSFMKELGKLHEELKRHPHRKIVFVSTPSLPNKSEHPLGVVSRNNEVTAVLNK